MRKKQKIDHFQDFLIQGQCLKIIQVERFEIINVATFDSSSLAVSGDVQDALAVRDEHITDGTVVNNARKRKRRSGEVSAMKAQLRATYGVSTDGVNEEAQDAKLDLTARFARVAAGVPLATAHDALNINIIGRPRESDIYARYF